MNSLGAKPQNHPDPFLVALDIDGTLVDYDGGVLDATKTAVQQAHLGGHHVVVSTGRSLVGTMHVLEDFQLRDVHVVTSNGCVTSYLSAETWPEAKTLHVETFDPASMLDVIAKKLPDAAYAVENENGHYLAHGEFAAGELAGHVTLVDHPERLAVGKVLRIACKGSKEDEAAFTAVAHELGLPGVAYSVGHIRWLDIGPPHVSKASALETLRGDLDVPAERTLAVGDATNDIEMLKWAHHSFSMSHSSQAVQEAAGNVVGDGPGDGVAQALESVLRVGVHQH